MPWCSRCRQWLHGEERRRDKDAFFDGVFVHFRIRCILPKAVELSNKKKKKEPAAAECRIE